MQHRDTISIQQVRRLVAERRQRASGADRAQLPPAELVRQLKRRPPARVADAA